MAETGEAPAVAQVEGEPPEPEGLEFDRAWLQPRWVQRMQWQAAVAACLVALFLMAPHYSTGPLASVAALSRWTLGTDASQQLPWRMVVYWAQRSVERGFWEGLLAGGPAAGTATPATRTALLLPVAGTVRVHSAGGAEIVAAAGAPVRAVAAGVVRRVLPDTLAGLGVEVEHTGGMIAVYRPLTGVHLAPGAALRAGGELGQLAAPGRLQFSLRVGGQAVDPAPYLAHGA